MSRSDGEFADHTDDLHRFARPPDDSSPATEYAADDRDPREIETSQDEHGPDAPEETGAEAGDGYIPPGAGVEPIPPDRELERDREIGRIAGFAQNLDPAPLSLLPLSTRLAYPWRCIGKLTVWGRYRIGGTLHTIGKSGTAAMVGRRTAVTASHIMPWGAESWWGEFIPALGVASPTRPFGTLAVTNYWGWRNDGVCGYDVVAIRLTDAVGERTGWMGYAYNNGSDDFYYRPNWFSGGYTQYYYGGGEMSTATNIKVRDVDNDSNNSREVETDNFSNHGWSGGPLFTWLPGDSFPSVGGVLSGREKDFLDPQRTVFAGGKPLFTVCEHGRANWG